MLVAAIANRDPRLRGHGIDSRWPTFALTPSLAAPVLDSRLLRRRLPGWEDAVPFPIHGWMPDAYRGGAAAGGWLSSPVCFRRFGAYAPLDRVADLPRGDPSTSRSVSLLIAVPLGLYGS